MIYIGSRYEKQPVFYTIDSRSGNTRPTVVRTYVRPRRSTRPTETIRWQEGARLDRVSQALFGSADRWWRLMDANPDILDPMTVTAGALVVLP